MDTFSDRRKQIIENLESKSLLKQRTYSNTYDVMQLIKDSLHELSGEINDNLTNSRLLRIEYRDRGKFEAQIQVAGDILIFSMHTNIFAFDNKHAVCTNEYATKNKFNGYCGVINIYNFLADSFKYNRATDHGYLIARIFINHEMSFFVEGVNEPLMGIETFGARTINAEVVIEIIESSILHAMDFDLYAPPFNAVKTVIVDQLNTKAEGSKIQTGKRFGFE